MLGQHRFPINAAKSLRSVIFWLLYAMWEHLEIHSTAARVIGGKVTWIKKRKLSAILKLTNETSESLLPSQMQHWEIVVLFVAKLMINKHMNTAYILLYLILSHNLATCCTVFIPLESGSCPNKIQFNSGSKGWCLYILMFQNLTFIQQEWWKGLKKSEVWMVCGNPITGLSCIRFL